MKPLINILTRTSGRPNYFRICRDTVEFQSYKNINHIVGTDDDGSMKYLRGIDVAILANTSDFHQKKNVPKHPLYRYSPFNLHLNILNNLVSDGYLIYLDDDDCLYDKDSIDTLAGVIASLKDSVDAMFFWKVLFPEDKILPEPEYWQKRPQRDHITGIGFCFHSKYLQWAVWDHLSCSDYRVINRLWDIIPNHYWIDRILTRVQRIGAMGGSGKRDDKI